MNIQKEKVEVTSNSKNEVQARNILYQGIQVRSTLKELCFIF